MELQIKYRVIQCSCGLAYAIPDKWAQERENDHKYFFCPACKKPRYYPSESDEERLQRMLTEERNCCISAREEANYFEKQAQGYKGYATRLKKQIHK